MHANLLESIGPAADNDGDKKDAERSRQRLSITDDSKNSNNSREISSNSGIRRSIDRVNNRASSEEASTSSSDSSEDNERFTFFFTKKYPFSNHYPCRFKISGRKFTCVEQYYMYKKAKYFGQRELARKIRRTDDPREMKQLGSRIPGFNEKKWYRRRAARRYMKRANTAKYIQNPELRARLLETAGTTLVETNPTDNRWGIGLSMDDPRAKSRRQWRGENWLGEMLTKIRQKLIEKQEKKDRKRNGDSCRQRR